MTTKNVFSQAVDAAVRALWDTTMESQDSELYGPNLGFQMYEPDVPAEQISTISGPGKGVLTVEGQQYGSNTRYKGYPVTVSLDKFTSELKWTEEDLHWLKKMPSSKRASTLNNEVEGGINALYANLNEEACKVFYLGHGTTNLTGGDGFALFYKAHTIRAGGTQANNFGTSDTERAFSADNFVEAVNRMNRFQDHNGRQMLKVRDLRIVIAPELEPTVQQALLSLYGPANANLGLQKGSKQAFAGRGITVDYIVAPDIPYAYRNYWSVIDMRRARYASFLAKGWMPRMNPDTDYSKGVFKNEASTLFGYYFATWQHAFGSKGDGTTIS